MQEINEKSPNSQHAILPLVEHQQQQHQHLPELCTVCGQRFKNTKRLLDHVIEEHATRSLSCDYCGAKPFADAAALQMHVIDVHQREVRHFCDLNFFY